MKYAVYLDGKIIGKTNLELGDPPMGVAFGNIRFSNIPSPYEFFRDYCQKNNVSISTEDADLKMIMTGHIPGLKVLNNTDIEIKGVGGAYIEGMEQEFTVNILGIEYPFYGEEFPEHCKAYENQFKEKRSKDHL